MSEPEGLVRQYRESHHRIAEMIAMGCTDSMIRQTLGVSFRRLQLLQQDPTFQELIASKSAHHEAENRKAIDIVNETMRDFIRLGAQDLMDTMSAHIEAAEGEEARLKPMQVLKLTTEMMDRFGYGKNSTLKVEH